MNLLAETQQAATGGGTSWFIPVMLVAMVLLLWLPMRRQKKAQTEMKARQATMEPGTRVMTSFGLYGTLRDMDRDQNKAVLEISPGQLVTVHSQTVTTVVDETPAVDEHTATGSGAPTAGTAAAPRATAADGAVDGSTAAPTAEGAPGVTDPAESTERRTWRDARGHDGRDNPTT